MNAHAQSPSLYAQPVAPETIRLERLMPTTPDRLWSWLTDPAKRALWLAGGSTDERKGGAIELVFRNSTLNTGEDDPAPARYAAEAGEMSVRGEILECDPPHRLAFTWPGGSEVTFDLAAEGDSTCLVVTHRKIARRGAMLSIAAGWHTHLDILTARLDGAEPPEGFWRKHTRLEAEYDSRLA
jgi:uncharacterized protein YndB with AHSA1/START domain